MSNSSRRCTVWCAAVLCLSLIAPALISHPPAAQSVPTTTTTIVGTVVDGSLNPIPGAVITLEQNGRTVAKTTSGSDGKFRLAGIAAGQYRVRAESKGFPVFSRDLRITAGTVSLQFPIVLAQPVHADETKAASASPTVDAQRRAAAAGPPAVPTAPPPPAGQMGAGRGGSANARIAPMPADASARDWPVYPPPSGETYARIDANRFQLTREQPLSTFGADVDTAAYTNVRRFLSAGQLPPRDAVRVEELLNYFRFDYPAPRDGRPVALTTEIADCPWAPAHKLVLIGARAMPSAAREVAGRNIVLLVDVSGSMAPQERLPLIRSAFAMFVDTLRPDDTVAIVTYAGTSGVALHPTPARHRDQIQRTIASLGAGGSTNGAAGLITAYRVARQAFIPGGVNRVIVATDGDFNVGMTSQRDLHQLIERERDSGVFLSVFGVGRDNLKDRTMEMLADRGNGHYAYLDSLQEARRILVREVDSTLETVAKDVKFQIEFNPAVVHAWKLVGYENRRLSAEAFNDDRRDAGELGAGHTVTVLYEVVPVGVTLDDRGAGDRPAVDPLRYQPTPAPPPQRVTSRPPVRTDEWLNAKLRYKLPESETSELISQAVRHTTGRARFIPFASTVAEFGLLLRDEPHNITKWRALASRLDALDGLPGTGTERSAFREMVDIAEGLARVQRQR